VASEAAVTWGDCLISAFLLIIIAILNSIDENVASRGGRR
jgi:hypothetical protein